MKGDRESAFIWIWSIDIDWLIDDCERILFSSWWLMMMIDDDDEWWLMMMIDVKLNENTNNILYVIKISIDKSHKLKLHVFLKI